LCSKPEALGSILSAKKDQVLLSENKQILLIFILHSLFLWVTFVVCNFTIEENIQNLLKLWEEFQRKLLVKFKAEENKKAY
jgi:hypothetical protein